MIDVLCNGLLCDNIHRIHLAEATGHVPDEKGFLMQKETQTRTLALVPYKYMHL